jgi:hypothetical protein
MAEEDARGFNVGIFTSFTTVESPHNMGKEVHELKEELDEDIWNLCETCPLKQERK